MALPHEDLAQAMNTSGVIRAGVGFRVLPYLQADFGFDAVPRAAREDFFQSTIIGDIHVHDHEFLLPIGGRGVLPIANGRAELFAGAGAAYLHYGEDVSVPGAGSDSSFHCQTCRSRGGWGWYTNAGLNVAIDRKHRFWIGAESRYIRGKTSGDPLGALPGAETQDAWINTAAMFTVRFP